MKLSELSLGESAAITEVGGDGALRQHFLDMGVIPGAEVTMIKLAPMGDPMELQIHGYELTLRVADAANIEVKRIQERTRKHERTASIGKSEHPGLGETGKYHAKGDGDKLPEGTKLTFALVGNQNCGKTGVSTALTTAGAAAILVFSLLYTPCVAAVASIKRELGTKWALTVVIWRCFVAWMFAFVVHAIVGML